MRAELSTVYKSYEDIVCCNLRRNCSALLLASLHETHLLHQDSEDLGVKVAVESLLCCGGSETLCGPW